MGEYSSSEEDGDAAWKAAISSAAAGASSYINGLSAKQDGAEDSKQSKTQQLPKHYQVKVSLTPYMFHFLCVSSDFDCNGLVGR